MRILLSTIAIVLSLVSCEDNRQDNITLNDPRPKNNAENVRLRTTIGFNGGSRSWSGGTTNPIIIYNYYCDTINPPSELVLSTNTFGSKSIEEKSKLLPNRKYYWYCDAILFEQSFPSSIYSFTTIDTSLLQNRHWKIKQTYSDSEYEIAAESMQPFYESESNTNGIYGEPYGFTILRDSVSNIEYGEINNPFLEVFPNSGAFKFGRDTVKIANWKYLLADFGVDYFTYWDDKPNEVILVLRSPYSNKVIVYNSTTANK